MIQRFRFFSIVASLMLLVSVTFLTGSANLLPMPGLLSDAALGLRPSNTISLGGSKTNGFAPTADGDFVFAAVSVGKDSSVFLAAIETATLEFLGAKVRGCPIADEKCLALVRGTINPQDLLYCDAKKLIIFPGFDDDNLYVSEVVFKDGKPNSAKAAKKIVVGEGPRAVAVTQDCTRVLTANEQEHSVSVVHLSYKPDGTLDKGESIAKINLDPNADKPRFPSPADITIKGDKAYTVTTDTWQVCEIKNINANAEDVKAGKAKIELGACQDVGPYPRAIALLGDSAYVINSVGDSVSQLALSPEIKTGTLAGVGDAPRGIATDGKCWVVVTNTGVDSGGASVTLMTADLKWSLTLPLEAAISGDPIVPTEIRLVPEGDAKDLWILNVGRTGEINIYAKFTGACP